MGLNHATETGSPPDPGDDLARAIFGPNEVEIFENLYAAYADQAGRAAQAILHDPELAADAAHAAYLELLRHIIAGHRWRDPNQARAAVLRNVRWAALKMLRTQRRRRETAMGEGAEGAGDVTWARAEAPALSDHVFSPLPPDHHAALRPHYSDGLPSAHP